MQRSQNFLMANIRAAFLLILLASIVTACGFKLRGVTELSFKTLYMQGAKLTITQDLKRSFKTNSITVVDEVADAELILDLINEANVKQILSLSGGGLVREFDLTYQVSFRTREAGEAVFSPVQTIRLRRDFSYNDNALLGKVEEEARLNNDMRSDAIREILRRLSTIKKSS